MLRNLISGLNKVKIANSSTIVAPSTSISRTPFLQQIITNNTQPSFQLPIEQDNELECMMNKTSRKTLKKHRKKLTGRKSNMRRN